MISIDIDKVININIDKDIDMIMDNIIVICVDKDIIFNKVMPILIFMSNIDTANIIRQDRTKLPQEQRKILDEIGFDWEKKDQGRESLDLFEMNLENLQDYKDKHGHCHPKISCST